MSCFRGGAIAHIVRSLYMERLPYIDEHSAYLPALPSRTWQALQSVLRSELGGAPPRMFVDGMHLEPRAVSGDWSGPLGIGHALPGFEVDEVRRHERLTLVGRHRFSRYALVFELDPEDGGTHLRAQTWAAFPGVLGRGYRMIVIGSRMHRLVVRRLLRRIAERV